jgi:hypothetical protein
MCIALSAFTHPTFRRFAPALYASVVEIDRTQIEEYQRKKEERRRMRLGRDAERGIETPVVQPK